jgi:uncharacterized protein (TIGR02452 family)
MSRNNLIQIYNNTKYLSEKYPKPDKTIKINDLNLNIIQNIVQNISKPKIKLFNDDTLVIAKLLYDETKSNILVLNMASEYKPGGGVENGAMAQEEELFRRTNYFVSLTQQFYPLKEFEGVYTKNVLVLKDEYYNIMSPFQCSFIGIAGIRKPNLKNYAYNSIDREIMKKKVEMIFKVAIVYGHKNIVLGALGCGVFGNPPEEVAEIFNESIKKYKNYFDNIYFAIKSVRDNNYDVFSARISKKIE